MEDSINWNIKLNSSCKYSQRLLDKLIVLNAQRVDKIDITEVHKAIYYAKKYHGDQKRQSGEPYYTHPLEVAYMISDYLFRQDIIITSILHDTLEDTKLTFEVIEKVFGRLVAEQVLDLTRIKVHGKITSAEMVDILWRERKYDVLLIKQFDRLHNMQTIGVKSPAKIKKITQETIYTFSVLAAALGIREIEEEILFYCDVASHLDNQDEHNSFFKEQDNQLLSLMLQNDAGHK